MKKCAICNKEINGGLVVDKECLEKLQDDLEFEKMNSNGNYKSLKKTTSELWADNERLRTENYELAGLLKGFEKGSEMLSINISELQAENAELKARSEKIEQPCAVCEDEDVLDIIESLLLWSTEEINTEFNYCPNCGRRVKEEEKKNV